MKLMFLAFLLVSFTSSVLQSNFLSEQKQFKRVRNAISEKGDFVKEKLSENGIDTESLNILIIAYKDEKQLDVYAKSVVDHMYKKLISYDICQSSGDLGPKRKQGDNQVPEGFYHIERFNPASDFHLSLGVNYPNQSDRKKNNASNLGGDIFIHGSCVTIGCIPMTDDKIKEIYLFAVYARNSGQLKIPVYIFPFKMTNQNFSRHKNQSENNVELINFWTNIKKGYDKFHAEKKELRIIVDRQGKYIF